MAEIDQAASAPKRTTRRQRWRVALRWFFALLAVLALGGFVRLATLQGLLRPVYISGASMADTLPGEHYALVCGDCGQDFRCGMDVAPRDSRAACPNCGFAGNPIDSAAAAPGARVLIDRLANLTGRPRRFDVVALQTPGEPSRLQVKRIAGLPGEHVALRNGDLYAEGEIVRKSLAQLREVAVLVHDDAHRAAGSRWAPDLDFSHWRTTSRGFDYTLLEKAPARIDWLTYRHLRALRGRLPSGEAAILDDYGYNQNVSRQLFEVSDLLLSCQAEASGSGMLALSLHDGRDRYEVRMSMPQGDAELLKNDVALSRSPLTARFAASPHIVEMATCDQQVLLAIDGRVVLRHVCTPSQRPFQPTSRPVAIGAKGISARISNLKLSRDIYYLDPYRTGEPWAIKSPLAEGEYLLLGDNAPISVDSRRWKSPGLSRKYFVGKVLKLPDS